MPTSLSLSPDLEPLRATIEATLQPFIKLIPHHPQEVSQLTLWQSKIGGLPYFPKNQPYPTNNRGRPLFLLAQLNFAEIPSLKGFPTTGILQFYIADDDFFGLDFDRQTSQQNFRVLYFPEVTPYLEPSDQNEGHLITDFSFLPEPQYFPLSTSCALQFEAGNEPVGISDYQFEKYFKEFDESLYGEYAQYFSGNGHKLGGYASFTQEDPRTFLIEGELYRLLLQLDTDDSIDMMWGDCGVGNFFIKDEDLQNLNFSNVLYHWDCY